MQIIEFQTQVQNGNIEIPDEFKDQLTGLVSVSVMMLTRGNPGQPDMLEQLWNKQIKVENFKPLTREEIYEGR